MAVDVFSVSVFLIVLRETIETGIIDIVLLAFLKLYLGLNEDQKVHKALARQRSGVDAWSKSEMNYEGAFCLIASVIITVMGAGLLLVGKLQDKWRTKLANSLEPSAAKRKIGGSSSAAARENPSIWQKIKLWLEKYVMFVLPFVTVLREGIGAIVFIAGVTFSAPATSVPLAVVVGIFAGCVVSYILYRAGSTITFKIFLVASCALFYLVAAGLFSRAVWFFETQKWNEAVGGDAAETGAGPGSYDIDRSVWHVNCCSPDFNGGGGWGFFNAILGWQNPATYGSVISYNVYWIFVIFGFVAMRFRELKEHCSLKLDGKAATAA